MVILNTDIKIKKLRSNFYLQKAVFLIKIKRKTYSPSFIIAIDLEPTANCQMSSVADFQTMLDYELSLENIKYVIKECVKKIFHYYEPKLFLVDVERHYEKKVDDLFKGYITNKSRYTSTNKSRMTLYLLNFDEMK